MWDVGETGSYVVEAPPPLSGGYSSRSLAGEGLLKLNY